MGEAYRAINPKCTVPALRLDAAAVQPLSMVVHELVTNAAKYGALSLPGGRVRMGWRLAPGEDGGRLLIEWEERGGPQVAGEPARRGFGSALIGATVRGQLGGRFETHWAPEGLRCTIDLPAQGTLAAQPCGLQEAALYGRRVLLVEDEPLVALSLQEMLQDAGCTVRGPASTLAEAECLAGEDGLDAAVLDVNLPGGPSLPLGAWLAARGGAGGVRDRAGTGARPGGRGGAAQAGAARGAAGGAGAGHAAGGLTVQPRARISSLGLRSWARE
jgi:CheY-like chemotaxis protein